VSRQRAQDLQLSENELVMTRDELDSLKDQIYVLHCALIDARKDLEHPRHTKESLRDILSWLMEAAEPVRYVIFRETNKHGRSPQLAHPSAT
jgi:hypothetical protein